jgi:hypothetical protein
MRFILAKFNGRCCDCGGAIKKGDSIGIVCKGSVSCAACSGLRVSGTDSEHQEGDDRAFPPSAAVLASDRALARRGLYVTRFSSGHVMTQNARGRCEDAPCCGCCS